MENLINLSGKIEFQNIDTTNQVKPKPKPAFWIESLFCVLALPHYLKSSTLRSFVWLDLLSGISCNRYIMKSCHINMKPITVEEKTKNFTLLCMNSSFHSHSQTHHLIHHTHCDETEII